METFNPEQLSIYKFEPDNIIMIHKETKTLYQYFQTPILALKQKNVFHNNLLQASLLPTGILYKKGITSMHIQTSKRLKMSNKQFYEEEEIVNTFSPILQCIQYLHSKDIIHGSISSQNILFNEEGDVLLRDWILQLSNNKYYETQKHKDCTKNDDIVAFGNILFQTATLIEIKNQMKPLTNYESILRKFLQRYSRGFILALYVILKRFQKFYPHLEKLLKNNESYVQSSQQLLNCYKKIKGQKQFKPAMTPSLLNYSNYKYVDLISKTPLTNKKVSRVQDLQNKKVYVEQTKKKNIERVHRIAEKNCNNINNITYQTSKKPDMALKKMSNIKINHNNLPQEMEKSTKKPMTKQEVLKFGSPLKRLRTVSKKKAI